MNELEVNEYIAAAEEALYDTPEYKSYFNALIEERKVLIENGCNPGSIEAILFSLWNMKIGWIIEHENEF